VLTDQDLLAEPPAPDDALELIATGPVEPFTRLARRFLGPAAPLVRA
jgi:glutamate racemase